MAEAPRLALIAGGDAAARNAAAARASADWLAFTREVPQEREAWLARAAACIARALDPDALAPAAPGAEPDWARGVLIVRRELFTRVGGYRAEFDDAGAAGTHADCDLGFRLEAVNARAFAAPDLPPPRPTRIGAGAPLAWARGRALDPLLALRHPRRVAARVDVTRLGALRLRSLAVRACSGVVLCVLLGAVLALMGRAAAARGLLLAAAALQFGVWARWRCAPLALPAALLAPWLASFALARGVWRAVRAADD